MANICIYMHREKEFGERLECSLPRGVSGKSEVCSIAVENPQHGLQCAAPLNVVPLNCEYCGGMAAADLLRDVDYIVPLSRP